MPKTSEIIVFDHKGIGQVLKDHRLMVPINQRSYAWEDQHVLDLFQDFTNAIDSDEPEYFLGTIVLTQPEPGKFEIADGQQRLATSTVLLAAIRDYFDAHQHNQKARTIETEFLLTHDLETDDLVPRLKLNTEDNDFFMKYVLSPPNSAERNIEPTHPSHKRIQAARKIASEHVVNIISPHKTENAVKRLIQWITFVQNNASVIVIKVPDYINAYTMFETLNDRGLRAAQSDILKNYLFKKAQERMPEVQPRWSSMIGTLESVGDDDLIVTYIRHLWITKDGPTKERELSKKIKESVNSKQRAVEFSIELDDSAMHYVALLNPSHEKWNQYGKGTKKHIEIISEQLRVAQIRPLMFAVAKHFSIEEARKAFKLFVAWSVRFLIAGGRGGLLDRNYAIQAHEIGKKEITTAKKLAASMGDVVPSDAIFEAAFAEARVSQSYLARYYLRALELRVKEDPEPEMVPNEIEEAINLEHILPLTPSKEWKIDPDTASVCFTRLGNMALMQAKVNVSLANYLFSVKRPYYQKSTFLLTQQIGKTKSWGQKEIKERQQQLAALAVKTWPITV